MIIIGYHGRCPDGFAGAWAAWKKFGMSFENEPVHYFPLVHGEPAPELLFAPDATVYLIDFSYPTDTLALIEQNAKRLVVLDHHEGVREVVEHTREHVFDNDRSGAGIAWDYFHPGEKLPRILAYVQENDLWRKGRLPHQEEIASYLGTKELTSFEPYDQLVAQGEDDARFAQMVTHGAAFRVYYEHVCDELERQAEKVLFAGHEVLAVNAPALFRSELGNRLATKQGGFALVYRRDHGKWIVSLRGDGSVDCAALAQQFGGNGHRNAASFRVNENEPLPFTFLPHHKQEGADAEETH